MGLMHWDVGSLHLERLWKRVIMERLDCVSPYILFMTKWQKITRNKLPTRGFKSYQHQYSHQKCLLSEKKKKMDSPGACRLLCYSSIPSPSSTEKNYLHLTGGQGQGFEDIWMKEQREGPGDPADGTEPHSVEATGSRLPLLGLPVSSCLLRCTAMHSHDAGRMRGPRPERGHLCPLGCLMGPPALRESHMGARSIGQRQSHLIPVNPATVKLLGGLATP